MNVRDLVEASRTLRRDSIIMTSAAKSGHPSSCLSCADILSVLFFHEMRFDAKNPKNPDNDEFILSKGHAAPVLYSALFHAGCIREDLKSLRKFKSKLEGHPVPRSLDWIKIATGSLGQGLGAGVGMALSSKMQRRNFRVYVLMGDSEVSEGSVYEAAEIASYYNLNNLVGIIDVNRLGQRGETMLGYHVGEYKKRFESLGWGSCVVDGHDHVSLIDAFRKARNYDGPFMIVAKTIKGKGVSFLEDRNGWHGRALNSEQLRKALREIGDAGSFNVKIRKPIKLSRKFRKRRMKFLKYPMGLEISTREAYGDSLLSLAEYDERIVAIDAEVSNSTFSYRVREKVPSQFVEAFIAEQNMVSMALGMSKKGHIPFSSTFSAFFTRAFDQIRMASISDGNLVFCGSHCGVSIGKDGASQMGLEDIAMFRSIDGSKVLYPSDAVSTRELLIRAYKGGGIYYIRTTRGKVPVIYKNSEKFLEGDFKVVCKSREDFAVLAGAGITLHEAIKAYEALLCQGIRVAVVDIYSIKPFNHKKFNRFLRKHGGKLVLAEDHRREGGIGEMIKSGIDGDIVVKHLAVEGIPYSGEPDELLEYHGIDWKSFVKSVLEIKG